MNPRMLLPAIVAAVALAIPAAAPAASTTLVINEVDYDQPSADTAEFLELNDTDEIDIERMRELFRRPKPWGGRWSPPPDDELRIFAKMGRKSSRRFSLPEPSITVVDRGVVRLARREWIAVHTPGHTSDHLCLYDPEERLFISGDHVLPTITPHIAAATGAGWDRTMALFCDNLRLYLAGRQAAMANVVNLALHL